eukprot:1611335-Pyramimonas_sp.AAC.1
MPLQMIRLKIRRLPHVDNRGSSYESAMYTRPTEILLRLASPRHPLQETCAFLRNPVLPFTGPLERCAEARGPTPGLAGARRWIYRAWAD